MIKPFRLRNGNIGLRFTTNAMNPRLRNGDGGESMRRYLTLSLVAFLTAWSIPGLAQDVTERFGRHGTVNWSIQKVQAMGIAVPGGVGGRAGQIRAAELDALRQILETVKGMRLSSETTVENYMLSSDVIRTRVEGVVRNFRRVGDPVYIDGSIEVTVEMDLHGAGRFYDAVMPVSMGGGAPFATGPSSGGQVYTGLIVDARGLSLRPAITPKIIADSGETIYGTRVVDRTWAIEHGMVGYAKDPSQARANDRVAPNPLTINALKATGSNRTDLVISDQDAFLLHGVAENFKFLQECRVIIIVD